MKQLLNGSKGEVNLYLNDYYGVRLSIAKF